MIHLLNDLLKYYYSPFIRELGSSGKLSTDDVSSSSCSSGHRISFRNISINKVAASFVLLGGLERVVLNK